MIQVAVILLAWGLGADPRRLGVLAVALLWPVAIVGLVVLAVFSARRDRTPRSALFCESVASDLRAGASMRQALVSSLASVGGQSPPSLSFAPLTEVARVVAGEFEGIGVEIEMTINAASRSGGASADIFQEIGSLAIARSEVEHEIRVATAPARATALVFVAAPAVYLVARANSGSLTDLISSPPQRVAGTVGLCLFALGLFLAVMVLWRSR